MVTFTNWGLNTCPAGEAVLYTGRAANARSSRDGATNVFCFLYEPVHANGPLANPLLVANVIALKENKKTSIPLLCAVCSASLRPAVFVAVGRDNDCPSTWVAEYSGIIAANPKWPSDYICVNKAVAGSLLNQWDGATWCLWGLTGTPSPRFTVESPRSRALKSQLCKQNKKTFFFLKRCWKFILY